MKTKFYLFKFLIFIGISVTAQNQQKPDAVGPVDPVLRENQLHSVFSNLDKTKIPTGLLLDAAVEFVNLKKFNGTIQDSSFTSSRVVSDIYNTLILSRLSGSAQISKTAESLVNDWNTAQQVDVIPLGGVFYKYSQFSDATNLNAINTGDPGNVIINNGKLEDKYVNGIWVNPYEEKYVFALAPIVNSFNKYNFKIKLPDNIFVSNISSQIQQIEYRISDSSPFQVLPYNQIVDVNYATAGIYTWTFKLTMTNGTVVFSRNKFTIEGHMDQYTVPMLQDKTSSLSQFTKISINGAKLYIKLATGHTQITNPLIVAEGFDTGIVTSPAKEAGDNDIEDFFTSLESSPNLKAEINSNSDIIYVDWSNGVDYIQNNANHLKEAIQWVNANKVGTNKNVVLGQSMGGLVARYALRDMEDLGLNHDTKLYISHDSPHLGANIPLGLQYLLRNISSTYFKSPGLAGFGQFVVPIFNQWITWGDVLTLTDVPAARQMLINYVNKNNQVENSVHDSWQNELKAKGYPQLTRNVAISNGSECGTDQTLNDLVRVYAETGKYQILNDIAVHLVGPFISGNPMLGFLASLPGNSKFVVDITARPMTSLNENKKVYEGSIKYKKKVLWVINTEVSLLSGSRSQPTNILPFDKYGGGRFSLSETNLPSFVSISRFSFIPTPSSIDYKFGNSVLVDADYQKPYSYPDDQIYVPFNHFVAETADINRPHISFSPRSGQFITNQFSNSTVIQNQNQSSTFLCGSKVKIGGESLLCGSNDVIYTTGFAPTIQWSIIQGANLVDIKGPSNQPQITIRPKQNANGLVKLQTFLSGPEGNNTVTKDIWLGKPLVGVTQINNPNYYNQSHFYLDATNLAAQGITNIKWTKVSSNPSSGISLHAANNSTTGWAFGPNNNWTMEVRVETSNSCGTQTQMVTITPPPALPCENFTLVKTASDNYAVLKSVEPPCSSNKVVSFKNGNLYNITVANSLGTIVISKKGDTFDLEGFPTGIYIVNISQDNKVLMNQSLIKN